MNTTKVLAVTNQKLRVTYWKFWQDQLPKTTAFTISFKNNKALKFPSDKLVRLAVKIKPAVLNTRLQVIDEAKVLLYSLEITSKLSEICTDDTIG